ncbi:non-specific lipid transfer protein GPI-anchored 10 [Malania oleifera]|uniref:non-specific lipid transfer protein GPI-anchored 10 n=1 Tax=Malania oleifera TaxID=397392 RepID=UPI0025ADCECA|nr:non-specific lipid transfer protein GPI-anchored 10 [Malania oleifera]
MASPHTVPSIAITTLLPLFLTCIPPSTLSQNPISSSFPPTLANCGPRLLPLASCAPFVQGSVQSPAQLCCDNLKQLYAQQPSCLCLLLNDTTMISFPINTTLALQLPDICNLPVSNTACSGVPVAPTPPNVSLGANTSSSAAAPTMVQVPPKPTIMGFGFGRSFGARLKTEGDYKMVVAAAATYLVAKLLCWT